MDIPQISIKQTNKVDIKKIILFLILLAFFSIPIFSNDDQVEEDSEDTEESVIATLELANEWVDVIKKSIMNVFIDKVVIGELYADFVSKNPAPVSVALITDADLPNGTWPVPYSYHTNVLRKMVNQGAKGIFIDFVFRDNRQDDSLESMIDYMCSKENPNLFFLSTFNIFDNEKGHYKGLRKEFEKYDGICYQIVPSKVSKPDILLNTITTYDYKSCKGENCVDNASYSFFKKNIGAINKIENTENSITMKLIWTDGFPKDIKEKFSHCHDNLLGDDTCAYHHYFTTSNLKSFDEDIHNYINGNYIFYGGSLTGSADNLFVPNYGKIAGVFVHAMAFENLYHIKNNEKYFLSKKADLEAVIISILIASLLFFIYIIRDKITTKLIIASASIAILAVIAYFYFLWASLDFIALTFLFLILANLVEFIGVWFAIDEVISIAEPYVYKVLRLDHKEGVDHEKQ